MPKFKVLRPIERDGKLYLPETESAPDKVKSAGHGQDIPVDFGGAIELTEKQAAELTLGQVEEIKSKGDGSKTKGKRESA
ncbi:MAG TPA: hypothetical protein VKW70_10645 [Terriglobia bacterium]|nr:hypothetical protein [Terriglobia bacterium]